MKKVRLFIFISYLTLLSLLNILIYRRYSNILHFLVFDNVKMKAKYQGGMTPYGYRVVDGWLKPKPREQAIIKIVNRMRNKGKTAREIIDYLTANDYLSRYGKPFHPKQISRMLGETRK